MKTFMVNVYTVKTGWSTMISTGIDYPDAVEKARIKILTREAKTYGLHFYDLVGYDYSPQQTRPSNTDL